MRHQFEPVHQLFDCLHLCQWRGSICLPPPSPPARPYPCSPAHPPAFPHPPAEFKAKHKIDVKTNAKAAFKLRTQCEKLKKILSANPEAPLHIECLMEDQDVRSSMTRDKLEELVAPLFPRVQLAMERVRGRDASVADQASGAGGKAWLVP
jgi:hypothetical protein